MAIANNRVRFFLLTGAAALPWLMAMPAAAQTVCSQAADGTVTCEEGADVVASGTVTPGTVTTGPGLTASSAGQLNGSLAGDISTDADAVRAVSLTSEGSISYVQDGSLLTLGNGADALLADAADDVSVTVGDVSTSGAGSRGIAIEGRVFDVFDFPSGTVNLACGNVTTTGANATGLDIFNHEANVSCGNVSATGAGSHGVRLFAETGAVELGDVVADGDGVWAGTLDFGDLQVSVGDVTVSGEGSTAISASARDGFIDVTCGNVSTIGNDSNGLNTYASDGTVRITCGNIVTQGDNSDAANLSETLFTLGDLTTTGDNSGALLLSAFYSSRGTVGQITTSGDDSIGIASYGGWTEVTAGDVTTSGDRSVGVYVEADPDIVVLDLGQVSTSGAEAHGIVINSGNSESVQVAIDGVQATGAGADAIRIGSGFASGPTDVAIMFTSSGDIVSADGAALSVGTLAAFDLAVAEGLEVSGRTAGIDIEAASTTLDISGTVTASEGAAVRVVGGPASLTIGSTGIVSGYVTFAGGADSVSNAGTFAAAGTSAFGGGSDLFTNSNNLLVDGSVVFAGLEQFDNVGGVVGMQDGAPDDRFEISGDYAGSGGASVLLDVSRSLDAADVFAVGGSVSGETILAINWVDSNAPVNAGGVLLVDGVADPNAFVVEGLEDFGLFALTLRAQDGDLYLMAAIDPAVTDLALLGAVAPDIWYQSFDAMRASITGRGSFLPRLGFWAQAYGGRDRRGGNDSADLFGSELEVSSRLETDRLGAQIGFDASVASVLVGVTGGYEQSKSEAGLASDLEVKGWNVGAYAAVGAAIGPYAVATVKHDRLDIDFDVTTLAVGDVDGTSTGGDLEGGWRGSLLAASIDVNAGVSMVRSSVDGFAIDGTSFDPGSATSVRGRIGGRVTLNGPFRPFAEARLFNEFGDEASTRIVSGDIDDSLDGVGRGAWARVEAGVGGGNDRALLSAWAEFGERDGWGLRAGYKF